MNLNRRILSLILCVLLAISLMPTAVWAASNEPAAPADELVSAPERQELTEADLSRYGYTAPDQVIGTNPITFDTAAQLQADHRESGLGDLIADSYRYAVERAEGGYGEPITLALTTAGLIAATLPNGDITISDAYNVSPYGIGADGSTGDPLVSVWLTGREIKTLCEIDASLQSSYPSLQIYLSGVGFTWNSHRLTYNKVMTCYILGEDGTREKLSNAQLYRVVTGLSCLTVLASAEQASHDVLALTPKYADGTEITDLKDCIVYDATGNELKVWSALGDYIGSFNGGAIPSDYSEENSLDRKIQSDSRNLFALISHPNRITFGVICLVLALILLVVKLTTIIVDAIRSRRAGGERSGYTAQHKHIQSSERQMVGFGLFSRHSKPTRSGHRYGKGYQPSTRRRSGTRRKFSSTRDESLPERMARIEQMEDIDEIIGFVKPGEDEVVPLTQPETSDLDTPTEEHSAVH